MVRLAHQTDVGTAQVVLHGSVDFLFPAASDCQPREAEEGLYSDVHSSYDNLLIDVRYLRLSLDQDRQRDSVHHGRSRFPSAGKSHSGKVEGCC